MISVEDMNSLVEGIMDFNSLGFTDAERASEAYKEHCKAMILEEAETEREEATSTVEELDSLCDTIVVATQARHVEGVTDQELLRCYCLIGEAIMVASRKGYDLNKALRAVNANNMTKFPLIDTVKEMYGEIWKDAACDWIESQGRYKDVTAYEVEDVYGDWRAVFKSGLKVVKWAGFVDVDIKDYV